MVVRKLSCGSWRCVWLWASFLWLLTNRQIWRGILSLIAPQRLGGRQAPDRFCPCQTRGASKAASVICALQAPPAFGCCIPCPQIPQLMAALDGGPQNHTPCAGKLPAFWQDYFWRP